MARPYISHPNVCLHPFFGFTNNLQNHGWNSPKWNPGSCHLFGGYPPNIHPVWTQTANHAPDFGHHLQENLVALRQVLWRHWFHNTKTLDRKIKGGETWWHLDVGVWFFFYFFIIIIIKGTYVYSPCHTWYFSSFPNLKFVLCQGVLLTCGSPNCHSHVGCVPKWGTLPNKSHANAWFSSFSDIHTGPKTAMKGLW